jgi:uncharacterized protein (TIGR00251 family)
MAGSGAARRAQFATARRAILRPAVQKSAPPPSRAVLRVRVQPRASRTELLGYEDGVLRLRLRSPPLDGAANAELLRFLAREVLGTAPSRLELLRGAAGRDKSVAVDGMDEHAVHEAVQRALGGGRWPSSSPKKETPRT